jgi:hypothetical protein
MTSESVPSSTDNTFHPMVPYKRPLPPTTSETASQRHFLELGERLNIDRDALSAGLHMPTPTDKEAFELGGIDRERYQQPKRGPDDGVPFAKIADRNKRARYSEFPSLPQVVQKFTSPFETAVKKAEGPTQVFVTTSQMVHHEDQGIVS